MAAGPESALSESPHSPDKSRSVMPNYWIEHCAPPRPRPQGLEWDVFISYRSLDRVWAVALYDMLRQCGYNVFLDQFVLVAGQGLASQLARQLARSASGV